MNRTLMPALFAAALVASAASAETRIQINIGNAPPPPPVYFRQPPPQVWMPEARVYLVGYAGFPYDCFRVGPYFYLYDDGWWYRARNYRGPYAAIEVSRVPSQIWLVPTARWKEHPHGMPPGLAKKGLWQAASHGRESPGHSGEAPGHHGKK